MRLLDVGCGWGGMLLHAARHHDVTGVGVTLSPAQQERARKRIAEAGLEDRVQVRLQDYRDIADGPYDAISSIGMFEHVGLSFYDAFFHKCHDLLTDDGVMVLHSIGRSDRPRRACAEAGSRRRGGSAAPLRRRRPRRPGGGAPG